MFSKSDISRDEFQLLNGQSRCGYDWWWHSFTAYNEKTGEAKPFFIEFFTCNPALGQKEPVLGQSYENMKRGRKPSYLMVKAGCWGEGKAQLHRFFGWKNVSVKKRAPFSISAEDCFASEKRLKGSISISKEEAEKHPEWMCDAGEISWNLKVKKVIPYNVGYGAGKIFRTLQLFEMFWHAEGMKTLYKGYIYYNGEKYIVRPETCYGYADKNWGKDFTSPWVWLSSNNLTSMNTGKKLKNSVFDIGGGRPKVGPVALKGKLLSAFFYEGKCFEFNFSKFWTFTRTKFDCRETDTKIVWHVEQKTWCNKMVTDVTCEKKDMLFVNYEAPNGLKKHNRLWNGGNGKGIISLYRHGRLIDKIKCENVGCEYGEYDD
ncbi:MAG TPA: hypothetical protein DCL29_05190 [Eubacterium sp.]|nr:hypothetical protein [Eubacterium sp.]